MVNFVAGLAALQVKLFVAVVKKDLLLLAVLLLLVKQDLLQVFQAVELLFDLTEVCLNLLLVWQLAEKLDLLVNLFEKSLIDLFFEVKNLQLIDFIVVAVVEEEKQLMMVDLFVEVMILLVFELFLVLVLLVVLVFAAFFLL